jgi:hypothetical protein
MDASDQVLLRLADPSARQTVLTADALTQLAATCYAVDPAVVSGPTTAVYERFDIAVPLAGETSASARLMRALLFDLPQLVADIVEGVLSDDAVEFIRTSDDLVGAVARHRPDVTVLHTDRADTAFRNLIDDPPHLRVVVLAGHERRAVLYDANPADVAHFGLPPDVLRRLLELGQEIR